MRKEKREKERKKEDERERERTRECASDKERTLIIIDKASCYKR